MPQHTEKTLVVFRRWPKSEGGDVIALFPEIEERGGMCESYMHVGQHASANYYGVVNDTHPARPEEYKALAEELTRIGYNLIIRSKWIRRR
jgi:hypothetical protein